ncbi:MAG: methylmalonyl Co-A mutase-associated GTPase MeaB [Thermomicrobiales bacterium]
MGSDGITPARPVSDSVRELVDRALGGDRRSIGRLTTLVEDGGQRADRVLSLLYARSGHAHVIGITGPPGAGKSTLTNALIGAYREAGHRVAVIAVDPSSDRTGGAMLGDRIRMMDRHSDEGVWVRSMANRGQPGGIAAATGGMVHLFDALGYDPIIVESVGAGQSEIAIADLVHTNLVVQAPGAGDHIQALKAGLLETADAHVVNKADLPGAARLARDLLSSLDLTWDTAPGVPGDQRPPPVFQVSAASRDGIGEVFNYLLERPVLTDSSVRAVSDRARAQAEVRARVTATYLAGLGPLLERIDADLVDPVAKRVLTPADAASRVMTTNGAANDNVPMIL